MVCNRDLTAPDRASRDSGLYVRENGEIRSMATLIPRWGVFYRHVMEQMLKGAFDSVRQPYRLPFLLVGNRLGHAGSGLLLPLPSCHGPAGPEFSVPVPGAGLHPLRGRAAGSVRPDPLHGGSAADPGGGALHGLPGGLRHRRASRRGGAGPLRPRARAHPGNRQPGHRGCGLHFLDLRDSVSPVPAELPAGDRKPEGGSDHADSGSG